MTNPAAVASYMRKAQRALDEARLLLGAQKAEGACNRAYYAMHDAAHAALLAINHEKPDALIKTHHSLIAAFGKELVLGGLIDAGFGRAFNKVQDMRQLADYSDEPPPLTEAQSAVEQAEAFVAAISAMIARLEA
jgi:uncharacterized protein (UPF0332 family)